MTSTDRVRRFRQKKRELEKRELGNGETETGRNAPVSEVKETPAPAGASGGGGAPPADPPAGALPGIDVPPPGGAGAAAAAPGAPAADADLNARKEALARKAVAPILDALTKINRANKEAGGFELGAPFLEGWEEITVEMITPYMPADGELSPTLKKVAVVAVPVVIVGQAQFIKKKKGGGKRAPGEPPPAQKSPNNVPPAGPAPGARDEDDEDELGAAAPPPAPPKTALEKRREAPEAPDFDPGLEL